MNATKELLHHLSNIEEKIGYHFKDSALLVLSFTHRSYVNEHRDRDQHNERLEFLGDSVLGLIMSEYVYQVFPDVPEGELSALRAKLVESCSCMTYVTKLDLGRFLLLGRGEKMNDGKG